MVAKHFDCNKNEKNLQNSFWQTAVLGSKKSTLVRIPAGDWGNQDKELTHNSRQPQTIPSNSICKFHAGSKNQTERPITEANAIAQKERDIQWGNTRQSNQSGERFVSI